MLHDEAEYPEPFKFLPERWILKNGQKQPRDPAKVAFGFGRRCVLASCLGHICILILPPAYVPAWTWQMIP
jgi:cytochrome P450